MKTTLTQLLPDKKMLKEDQIVIYKDSKGETKVDVKLHDDTVWLTQAQISELFGKERSVIAKHIIKVLQDQELEEAVYAKFAHTGTDGKIYQTQVLQFRHDHLCWIPHKFKKGNRF